MKEQAPRINFLEAKMRTLLRQRVVAKAALERIDGEIGKLDLKMSRPYAGKLYDVNWEPVDLDRDAMYRKP